MSISPVILTYGQYGTAILFITGIEVIEMLCNIRCFEILSFANQMLIETAAFFLSCNASRNILAHPKSKTT